ncbi:MAG: sigma-54-dependent transcriptional regulator, partial [Nitrospiraceae bacterium]
MDPCKVLIVGGSPENLDYIQGLLSSSSITSVVVTSASEAVTRLGEGAFYAVVLDLDGTPMGGRDLLVGLQKKAPNTSFIVIAEDAENSIAAECTAAGAFEFLTKPLDRSSFLAVMHRALTRSQLCSTSPVKNAKRKGEPPSSDITGDSDAMQEVYHWVTKVAPADANVCIYGESGTGKELIARAIHDNGRRRGRPFVILDCAAIPEGLMESEMFGHVRGAFTSAVENRIGVFQ